jgi:hypothetical protein
LVKVKAERVSEVQLLRLEILLVFELLLDLLVQLVFFNVDKRLHSEPFHQMRTDQLLMCPLIIDLELNMVMLYIEVLLQLVIGLQDLAADGALPLPSVLEAESDGSMIVTAPFMVIRLSLRLKGSLTHFAVVEVVHLLFFHDLDLLLHLV